MLPREDGGVVDNKLKARLGYHARVFSTDTPAVGIRDDKHPGHGHFDRPSPRCSTHAG
jgi:hypothetical protein